MGYTVPSRKAAGVVPVQRLKARVNAVWSANPVKKAMSAIE